MSGVGPIGGADRTLQSLPSKRADASGKVLKEPKDKVDIKGEKKEISGVRKVFEKVLGAPMGVVTMAANAFGGVITGGVAGVEGGLSEGEQVHTHTLSSGFAYVVGGAAAGAMAGGVIGGVVGAGVGLAITLYSNFSKGFRKVAQKVNEKAVKSVSDNVPSDSKVKDTVRNFTEGGIVGGIYGGIEGFKSGSESGAGFVSGVIEGTKGFVGALAGTYESDVPKKKEDVSFGKKVLNAIISLPRKASKLIVGTATGSIGAALGIADGAIQGTILGLAQDEEANATAHDVIRGLQIAIGGGVAGFATGGFVGAGIGLGVGALAGVTMGIISHKTGSDIDFANGVTDAVHNAQKDNVYEKPGSVHYDIDDRTTYETFRDGVEGTLTGAGAGIREGFKEGYQVGSGVVDGVFDAAKGIAKGVVGGISGVFKNGEGKEA